MRYIKEIYIRWGKEECLGDEKYSTEDYEKDLRALKSKD